MSIYYTWKNIRQQYQNNKLKIIAPTWNDEFELADGSYSVSDIQGYAEYIIKKKKTLPTNYINRINNRFVFRKKDDYKLELETFETMKSFDSKNTNKIIDKTKNGENVPNFELVEVVLLQCNLVVNQYQEKCEVLCSFSS